MPGSSHPRGALMSTDGRALPQVTQQGSDRPRTRMQGQSRPALSYGKCLINASVERVLTHNLLGHLKASLGFRFPSELPSLNPELLDGRATYSSFISRGPSPPWPPPRALGMEPGTRLN